MFTEASGFFPTSGKLLEGLENRPEGFKNLPGICGRNIPAGSRAVHAQVKRPMPVPCRGPLKPYHQHRQQEHRLGTCGDRSPWAGHSTMVASGIPYFRLGFREGTARLPESGFGKVHSLPRIGCREGAARLPEYGFGKVQPSRNKVSASLGFPNGPI